MAKSSRMWLYGSARKFTTIKILRYISQIIILYFVKGLDTLEFGAATKWKNQCKQTWKRQRRRVYMDLHDNLVLLNGILWSNNWKNHYNMLLSIWSMKGFQCIGLLKPFTLVAKSRLNGPTDIHTNYFPWRSMSAPRLRPNEPLLWIYNSMCLAFQIGRPLRFVLHFLNKGWVSI